MIRRLLVPAVMGVCLVPMLTGGWFMLQPPAALEIASQEHCVLSQKRGCLG